jgi:hypothetical protein
MYQKTKEVSVYGKNVSKPYLIQMKLVSLKYGSWGKERGAACQDIPETKGVSDERRKTGRNSSY